MAQDVGVANSFIVQASQNRVWRFLRDPISLSACIPGVSDIKALEDGTFRAIVEVKISLLTARFHMEMQIAKEEPPLYLVAEMRGKDDRTGSLLESSSHVELKEAGADETEVEFRIDARLSGLLSALGGGMAVKLKSRQMAASFAAAAKQRIEGAAE